MTTDGLYIIEPDRHFPFEDKQYSRLVYKLIERFQPEGYINIGDALDFYQLSTYDQDPRRKNDLIDDLSLVGFHYDNIEARMKPDSRMDLLEGNHCYRLWRYICRQAPALHSIVPSVPKVLDLDMRNARGKCRYSWHPMAQWDHLRLGNTVIHHGYYFSKSTAVSNLDKYRGCNFIQGHNHRIQYASNGDFFSASLGHGARPDSSSHTPAQNDHAQAIAFLTVRKGKGSLEIFTVKHGRAIVRGELMEG